MTLPFISQVDLSLFKDKRVLVRASLNVPMEAGEVADTFRLESLVPTIKLLQGAGAGIILISHHDGEDETQSLEPVAMKIDARFVSEFPVKREALKLLPGEIVVLENLRHDPREKLNDQDYSKTLASLADFYVNEDFGTSHREHASIVGIPNYIPSFLGLQFEVEFRELSRAFDPEHPFLFILGGAKFSTKEPILKAFLSTADDIFVGGALANNFFKSKGYEVGHSRIDAEGIIASEVLKSPKIRVPTDVVVRTLDGETMIHEANEVGATDNILDIGPKALLELQVLVRSAKFILWNGPLGNFETGFKETTEGLAKTIASAEAVSIVGGGDTLAAIKSLGLFALNKSEGGFSFISTAGGAMLEFLATRTLPGILESPSFAKLYVM